MIYLIIFAVYCELKRVLRKMEGLSAAPAIVEIENTPSKIIIGNTEDAEAAGTQNYRPVIAALKRSIEQNLAIINSTRDPETGINCFAQIRRDIDMLSAETANAKIKMGLGDKAGDEMNVGDSGFSEYFGKLKEDWLRGLFLGKMGTFLKQAEGLEDPVMKTECLRNALRAACDGLLYLSEDGELTAKANLVKEELKSLAAGPEI